MTTATKTRVRIEIINVDNHSDAPSSEPTWCARLTDVATGKRIDHRVVAADWGGTGTYSQAKQDVAEAGRVLARKGYTVVD